MDYFCNDVNKTRLEAYFVKDNKRYALNLAIKKFMKHQQDLTFMLKL